jgi:hypothetical protein
MCVVHTTLGDVNKQQSEDLTRISDKILYYYAAIRFMLYIVHHLRYI